MSPISEGEAVAPSETHKMHRHSHNKVLSLQTTNGFLHVSCLLAKVQQECSSCRVSALSFNYYLIKVELTTTAVAPPANSFGRISRSVSSAFKAILHNICFSGGSLSREADVTTVSN